MKGIDFFLCLLFFFFQDTGSIQLIYGIISVVMVLSIFLNYRCYFSCDPGVIEDCMFQFLNTWRFTI